MKNKLINSINSLLKSNIWIILSIIIIIIFFHFFTYKLVECFDLSNISSSVSGATNKPIPEEYQYLAPLPEGYAWSTETQDKFIAFLQKDPNSTITKTDLASMWMKMLSEEEAKYYMDNDGTFHWDEYVINYFTTKDPPAKIEEINQLRKMMPNRFVYKNQIANNTVPKLKMVNDIFSSNTFKPIQGTDNRKWYCNFTSDHYDINVIDSSGETSTLTDYSNLPDLIPNFSFEGEPCNICNIKLVKPAEGEGSQPLDIYDSSNNKCKFQIAGEIPEAYNVYIGKYGNAQVESTPQTTTATTSGDEYKKCVQACNKY